MTSNEANKIDINNETSLDKLRELVMYWQNLAYQNELIIKKSQTSFTLDDINLDEDINKKQIN